MTALLKIAASAFAAVMLISLTRTYKPELTAAVSVCASVIMLLMILDSLKAGLGFIAEAYGNLTHGREYLPVILKVLGIAYVTEFAAAMCADAGEKAIGSKVELAGKIAIFFAAAPVFSSLIELFNSLV